MPRFFEAPPGTTGTVSAAAGGAAKASLPATDAPARDARAADAKGWAGRSSSCPLALRQRPMRAIKDRWPRAETTATVTADAPVRRWRRPAAGAVQDAGLAQVT